jgi:DNA-binding NtrC family response regulator
MTEDDISKDPLLKEVGLVFRSESMAAALRQARKAADAPGEPSVLILGETGVGKELFARYIHLRSSRNAKPFVAENCAKLRPETDNVILFGTKGRVWSEVDENVGIIAQADKGTLFLDEAFRLSISVQGDMLRVLEERMLRPYGGTIRDQKPVDFRLLCATSKDPQACLRNGELLPDFYHRIKGIEITVPPLRKRPEDLSLLLEYFVSESAKSNRRRTPTVSEQVRNAFESYSWPGNVRQLKKEIESAVVMDDDGVLGIDDLSEGLREELFTSRKRSQASVMTPKEQRLYELLTEEEERQIYNLGREYGFDQSLVAKNLGCSRANVSQYLKGHKVLKELWDIGLKRGWMDQLEQKTRELPADLRDLVNESRDPGHGVPLVIPRWALQHPLLTKFVPQAAFRILLVFPGPRGESTVRITPERRDGEMICKLVVDIRHQLVGIYNNEGKKFLRRKLGLEDKATKEILYKASRQVHLFLMDRPRSVEGDDQHWNRLTRPINVPFRWTSGGVLPIAKYKGKEWATLFFRDIPQVGWNVGNGASEEAAEFARLDHLIARESSEEIMLLDRKPKPDLIDAMQFTFVERLPHYGYSFLNPDLNPKDKLCDFVRAHQEIRWQHDEVRIEVNYDPSGERRVDRLSGPDDRDHPDYYPVEVNAGRQSSEPTFDVIWSLNPLECGIEAIRLYRFELNDGEWLMDGEIFPAPWSPSKWLVRRPVILLSVPFLHSQFLRHNHTFGPVLDEEGSEDCKRLDEIPREGEDYILFMDFDGNDIDLREHRLLNIQRDLAANSAELSRAESDEDRVEELTRKGVALQSEAAQIRQWLDGKDPEKGPRKPYEHGYRQAFTQVYRTGRLEPELLRTLCPVTWKTLELAFENKYL